MVQNARVAKRELTGIDISVADAIRIFVILVGAARPEVREVSDGRTIVAQRECHGRNFHNSQRKAEREASSQLHHLHRVS
jgi:hypothetical protein